jgi:hypothetical protein
VADPNLRLLNSFLDYLKVEKGLAPLSVRKGILFCDPAAGGAEFEAKRRRFSLRLDFLFHFATALSLESYKPSLAVRAPDPGKRQNPRQGSPRPGDC